MSAQVVRLGANLAERYARFLAAKYLPADREEAVAEYRDMAERMVASGRFNRDDLQLMIEKRRCILIMELAELNRI